MSMVKKVEKQIAGRVMSIETGKLAKQAAGAVMVCYGESVVFASVVSAEPREGMDYFPLFVDYREKLAAAGKFPGGFIKREGRPTLKEILTMRAIDRPMRPLFPKGFRNEVQIQAMVWSADQQNDPDTLAMIGASAAVCISDIPFDGPVATVRIGRIDNQFVINPTIEEQQKSEMEMLLGGNRDGVNMIEVGAQELSEELLAEAIEFGHKSIVEICEMILELAADCGKAKYEYKAVEPGDLVETLEEKHGERYRQARTIVDKQERARTIGEIFDALKEDICPEGEEEPKYTLEQVRVAIEDFQEKVERAEILAGRRAGGRGFEELRSLSGEVAVLPRTHGSAIFTRGETQALVTATLGTSDDAQTIDGLIEEYDKKFMLHYNFPPFCVGETGRVGAPSRREIGHGTLAERSLHQVIPSNDDFPYTLKLVCDILESNGSSSMATVCGGTLALMDAGVPIKQPVAGISIGLVSDENRHELLTDIIGDEDHFGDMDFKVAGTQRGVTGVQLDLKRRFLPFDIIRQTFERAKKARMEILHTMLSVIEKPRQDLSVYAPKLVVTFVPEEMIGKIIGPGGSQVRKIQEQTGANIEIEDDGKVYVSCSSGDGHLKALEIIESMTQPTQVGKVYNGTVVSVKDFGVFVEFAPGKEGMCHISELADHYVRSVGDICKVGDELAMKVIAIDEQGRVKLSRKAALREESTANSGN